VYRFEGKLWYDHEAFQEFLWWMEIITILQVQTEPNANRVSVGEITLAVNDLINQIQLRDKNSACLVEKLLQEEQN
jgi:hypothetical protein